MPIPLLASDSAILPQSPDRAATTPRPAVEEVPVFAASVGFNYLQTNLTGVQGGASPSYTLGWYGIPQVFLTKHISLLGDFTNFYNYHAHTEENVHGFTGGPVYTFSSIFGITPYGFVEGGAVRDSQFGVVNWNAAVVGGAGFNIKLTHALAFQVIPGEYVATHLPNGNWQSNYTTKAGFTLTSFRFKHRG